VQLLIPIGRKNRRRRYLRLRFQKNPQTGTFISKEEALIGVILLTLSVLALHWIISGAAPVAERETPVAASTYKA
jgi:hypothetical protein